MNVLVTGANGQLGRALRRIAVDSSHRYLFSDILEDECTLRLDITDADAVSSMVKSEDIDVIVNCAAYTDVNRAEDEEEVAMKINALAPANLAEAASRSGALLIHISTDYVFDGLSCRPYTEDMPTSPLGAYGRTKLAGEQLIKESGCRHMIFRTAWLYYTEGRNFVKTIMEKTACMPTMKVVFDQVGTPTNAYDLAELIYMVIEEGMTDRTGIYHYSNEGVCSWYDFAKEICAQFGHLCEIEPCHTDEFPTKASRPHFSVLDKTKVKETFGIAVPHWKDSLEFCIRELMNAN